MLNASFPQLFHDRKTTMQLKSHRRIWANPTHELDR